MAMENNTDGKEMAEKLDEFADMIMTETRNECKELNDFNGSRYDTPAKRLRVDISEGTIYSTMTPQGADFSPSIKDDIIAVLDRLDELENK
jgi:hypothetical protein